MSLLLLTTLRIQQNLLLDMFPTATFAYSVRKLRTAYTGSCLRIRRDSDNAELDIGFDVDDYIDESAIIAFVGANNAFVVTWYDQSGNGNNATAAVVGEQPVIVSSGTIIKENSIVAIGGGTTRLLNSGVTGASTKSIFVVANLSNNAGEAAARVITSYSGSGGIGNELLIGRLVSTNTLRYLDGAATTTVTGATAAQHQFSAVRTTSTISVNIDGGTASSTASNTSTNANNYKLFEESNSIGDINEQCENISEIIFYSTNQSSNRSAINLNQKTYFGTP